jgi:hypothetical protein
MSGENSPKGTFNICGSVPSSAATAMESDQLEEALFRVIMSKSGSGSSGHEAASIKCAMDYLGNTLDLDKLRIMRQILEIKKHGNLDGVNSTSTIINNSRNNRNVHKISILSDADIDENTYM